MPNYLDLLESLLIAIALGVLIGAERGIASIRKQGEEKATFAGIRTFTLISLLGALSLHFARVFEKTVFVVAFLGLILLVTAAYIVTSNKEKDVGTTTEITAILTFLYGALCVTEYRLVAVVLAIVTTVILYTKKPAHLFLGRITDEEFYATLKFAVIAFVVLPFLPRDDYFGFFNPYRIWVIVVIISGIEFGSYIVVKLMNPRKGMVVMGFLGGIISSTALVIDASRKSKVEEKLAGSLAFSSSIASSTVFLKLLAEIYVVNSAVLKDVAFPLLFMFALGMIGALFVWQKGKEEKETITVNLKSPFTLTPALKFGALFTLILLVTSFANRYFGTRGLYITSALSGLVNLDAPTVSLANLAYRFVTVEAAKYGIVIACCINTISKALISYFIGSKEFSRLVFLAFSFPVAGGVVYLIVSIST
ncbi:MAG: hypothetical protein KatS3mg078_1145 [Deltaproteobacteria bacterium]|jgi:uncharacterized membrane protein (DUF4010 family)|nr:MAG: hypothetical protein KatS3mg078_1145 [Deltaproteobacteria bacterium]